jgi:hypothetical protein
MRLPSGKHVRTKLIAALIVAAPGALRSQSLQPEARVEALASRTNAVHAVAGINTAAGMYVRVAALAGAGLRRARGEWRPSGQLTVAARFHFDPLGEFRRGLYVAAGGTALLDEGVRGRVRAFIAIGVDGKSKGRGLIPGVELGLGGGVRFAVTIRQSRKASR